MRLALTPRSRSDVRYRPLAEGYGRRKRQREVARAPLLAQLPGYIPQADEFEERQAAGNRAWVASWRAHEAASWLRVLRWRRGATEEERLAFAAGWRVLPHTAVYALDLIYRITGRRAE